jgi:hypothetical protein
MASHRQGLDTWQRRRPLENRPETNHLLAGKPIVVSIFTDAPVNTQQRAKELEGKSADDPSWPNKSPSSQERQASPPPYITGNKKEHWNEGHKLHQGLHHLRALPKQLAERKSIKKQARNASVCWPKNSRSLY